MDFRIVWNQHENKIVYRRVDYVWDCADESDARAQFVKARPYAANRIVSIEVINIDNKG